MNEQIKEWTEESGLAFLNGDNWMLQDELKYFAKLVAQHERERIFGELLKMHEIASSRHNYYLHAVLTIRARGEA